MKKYYELKKKCNVLQNENETLKNIIKNQLYKGFFDKLEEPDTIARLKADNKRLRMKLKLLNEQRTSK